MLSANDRNLWASNGRSRRKGVIAVAIAHVIGEQILPFETKRRRKASAPVRPPRYARTP